MSTAYIGEPPYGADATNVRNALADGHRHLIFVQAIHWDLSIYLDPAIYGANQTLILESAGPHIVNCKLNPDANGNPPAGPMLHGGEGWTIHCRHVQFNGSKPINLPAYTHPVCRFTNFASFEAINSFFGENFGGGLYLERTNNVYAATVRLVSCACDANEATGLLLNNVGSIEMLKGMVQNNVVNVRGAPAGIHVIGGGGGTIRGVHFEANGGYEEWAIVAESVSSLNILDCYAYASNFWLKSDTSNCKIENIAFFEVIEGGDYTVMVKNDSGTNVINYPRKTNTTW